MDYILIINNILTFILALYVDPNLPRKIVDIVIDFIHDFLRKVYVPSLKSDILTILKNEKITDSSLREIEKCFNKYGSIFETVETEPKRFQLLRKKGLIDFEEFVMGTSFKEKIVNNDTRLIPMNLYGVFIPLRESLKLFLEIPGLYCQIIDYMKKLSEESHIITNIIQANLWKQKYCK